MEINNPTGERAIKNKKEVIINLQAALNSIADLKTDWVKQQKFEDTAKLREIEKLIDRNLKDFKEI